MSVYLEPVAPQEEPAAIEETIVEEAPAPEEPPVPETIIPELNTQEEANTPEQAAAAPVPKKRGRPKKNRLLRPRPKRQSG